MANTKTARRIGYQGGAGEWLRSVLTGSVSAVPVRFIDGDHVEVLNDNGEVIGDGIVEQVAVGDFGNWSYFVTGFLAARPASALRLIKRGR